MLHLAVPVQQAGTVRIINKIESQAKINRAPGCNFREANHLFLYNFMHNIWFMFSAIYYFMLFNVFWGVFFVFVLLNVLFFFVYHINFASASILNRTKTEKRHPRTESHLKIANMCPVTTSVTASRFPESDTHKKNPPLAQ